MKKENILKLFFAQSRSLQKRVMEIILFISFIYFNNCFSIFRPIPMLEENKSEILKADRHFILLNEDLTPITNPDFTSLDKKLKSLQNSKSFHELNNLAVYSAKLSLIETSEEVFKILRKEKPNEIVPVLNLLRIYYLLDEYDIAKQMLNNYYKSQSGNKKKIVEIMNLLRTSNRPEEYVILLDVISNYREYEMQALEELGLYFLSIRDLNLAKSYFDKILTIYAYNSIALFSLMQIHSINESWADVITYGLPLKKESKKEKGYFGMMAKAYFELGEYAKAIKNSEEAPDLEKSSFDFLIVWRDSILSNDIRASITHLNRYFQIIKKKNPSLKEEEFFIISSNEGKQALINLLNGY